MDRDEFAERIENLLTFWGDKKPASSFEFGKASQRHKVYYNDVPELVSKMQELKDAGLIDDIV